MDYIFGPSGVDVVKGRKLQVRVGSSLESLRVTRVNSDDDPHFIDSPYFTGFLVVRVKNFEGVTPEDGLDNDAQKTCPATSEEYFNGKKRLFALQLSGRFKHNYTADDIVFGSQFEKKCTPPYGSSIAMKFASLIDPALQTDIFSDSPWIFSPILCSMNVVNVVKAPAPIVAAAPSVQRQKPTSSEGLKPGKKHERSESNNALPKVGAESTEDKKSAKKDKKKNAASDADLTSSVLMTCPDPGFIPEQAAFISGPVSTLPPSTPSLALLEKWKWGGNKELEEETKLLGGPNNEWAHDSWADRRKHFQKTKSRLDTVFSPDHIYNFEIYAPFINLSTFDLSLGININVLQYLNNQPLRMMAKSVSLGKYLFVIEFDLVDVDEKSPTSTVE